jgi:hypothetical protein
VFIQSTASVPVQTSMPPGKFVLKLSGAKIVAETNRLPLETRFFNTPVTRVSIASVKDGITVTLDLRAAVTPQVSSERGPSGYYFTYIDLPAGQYAQEVPVPETAAKPVDVPPQPEHTTYLDGELDQQKKAKAAGQASASAHAEIDTETPPGIKPKSSTSSKANAKAGIKLGK